MQNPNQNIQETPKNNLDKIRSMSSYINSLKSEIDITNPTQLQDKLNQLPPTEKLLVIAILNINQHCAFLHQSANYDPLNFTSSKLRSYKNLLYKICDKDAKSAIRIVSTLDTLFKEVIAIYQAKSIPGFFQGSTKISTTYTAIAISLEDINIMLAELVTSNNAEAKSIEEHNRLQLICTRIITYLFEHYYIFEQGNNFAYLCYILLKKKLLPSLSTIINTNNSQTLLMGIISLPNFTDINPLKLFLEQEINLNAKKFKQEHTKLTGEQLLQTQVMNLTKIYWRNLFITRDQNNQTVLHHIAIKLCTSDMNKLQAVKEQQTDKEHKADIEHQAAKEMLEFFWGIIETYQLYSALQIADVHGYTPLQTINNCGYYITQIHQS